MKYRVTLAYDGTNYHGWQMQTGWPTIQGVFEAVLAKLAGAPVTTFAAGRTDAGVHAAGQVISFQLAREWQGDALQQALNGNLPPDIRALAAVLAAENFHARFDARAKTYCYQIYTAAVMSPFLARYAWHYPHPLNIERMMDDARALLGTHDFTAFTVADSEVKTHLRTVTAVRSEREDDLLKLFFSGDGFLRYQARTMVGALVEANRGRLRAGSIAALLASRDRRLTGAPAPARGLTLMKVEY